MSGASARASLSDTPPASLIEVLAATEARSAGVSWSRCWWANSTPRLNLRAWDSSVSRLSSKYSAASSTIRKAGLRWPRDGDAFEGRLDDARDHVATEQRRRVGLEERLAGIDQDDRAGLHGLEHVEPIGLRGEHPIEAGTCSTL